MKRAPSIKSLLAIPGMDTTSAKKVRDIIHSSSIRKWSETDTFAADFPNTYKWVSSCYNYPHPHEIRMEMLNEVLEGFGVEARGDFGDYPPRCDMEYINLGDTYTPTIVYHKGSYLVRSWGDIAETYNY